MNSEVNSISILRFLPAVDALLKTETAQSLLPEVGAKRASELARLVIEKLRQELQNNIAADGNVSREMLLEIAQERLKAEFESGKRQNFQRVINATGVLIHTNLGRAPLAEAARKAIVETASGYCTLEYDLETGQRGRRGRAVEKLLCELTGAENAIVVNNCAAAAFLVLSALSAGGEAIVSRGELVEIGGDFRVPDVMSQSGTKLVEVGTTNRTKLSDFSLAVNENTKLLVRVHPSNYRIIGFTAMPALQELAELARERNVLLYEDAGSGALVDLSELGLGDEPLISDSIKAGADVVTFSGDKLLGTVQAGIIIGKSEVVEKIRKHPLYRAMRVDKIAYAALTATLEIYRRGAHFREIPVLRMLSQTETEIEQRANEFIEKAQKSLINKIQFEIVAGVSAIGGGSAPLTHPSTSLIALRHEKLSSDELERRLRFSAPPVIARIENDKVLLDLRTVSNPEEAEIILALAAISNEIQL
jgi:L-seryl-tRNA(Ser) seleniumtransferase